MRKNPPNKSDLNSFLSCFYDFRRIILSFYFVFSICETDVKKKKKLCHVEKEKVWPGSSYFPSVKTGERKKKRFGRYIIIFFLSASFVDQVFFVAT